MRDWRSHAGNAEGYVGAEGAICSVPEAETAEAVGWSSSAAGDAGRSLAEVRQALVRKTACTRSCSRTLVAAWGVSSKQTAGQDLLARPLKPESSTAAYDRLVGMVCSFGAS